MQHFLKGRSVPNEINPCWAPEVKTLKPFVSLCVLCPGSGQPAEKIVWGVCVCVDFPAGWVGGVGVSRSVSTSLAWGRGVAKQGSATAKTALLNPFC